MIKNRLIVTLGTLALGASLVGIANAATINSAPSSDSQSNYAQHQSYMTQDNIDAMNEAMGITITKEDQAATDKAVKAADELSQNDAKSQADNNRSFNMGAQMNANNAQSLNMGSQMSTNNNSTNMGPQAMTSNNSDFKKRMVEVHNNNQQQMTEVHNSMTQQTMQNNQSMHNYGNRNNAKSGHSGSHMGM